jgi:uncharacterized membrane protein (UPF0127 family)
MLVAIAAYFVAARVQDDGPHASGAGTAPARGSGAIADALRDSTPATAPFAGLTTARLAVDGDCKHLVVADSLDERVQGLRGRSDAAPYDGMLFVFDAPNTAAFTMSGVPAALDIGFYDSFGNLVSRLRMEPCPKAEADCPVYRSDSEFTYALETGAGALRSGSLGSCPS